MPKITAIMGVYNCPCKATLKQAVDSIIHQSYDDFEFIICDDGSDNETLHWLNEFSSADSRIVIIRNEKNEGLASALNRCIERATGTYIARQDADDISNINRFQIQVDFLNKHKNIDFVGSNGLVFDASGLIGEWKRPRYPSINDFLFNSPFIHGSIIFRREVFEKCGGYNSVGKCRKYEDYDFLIKAYAKGLMGANVNQPLYSYYKNKEEIIPLKMRIDEFAVRKNAFPLMKIPIRKKLFYVLKPLLLFFVPNTLLNSLKKIRNRSINEMNYIGTPKEVLDLTEIASNLCKTQVVSFDVFDTLLFRPLARPSDVFYFVEEKTNYPGFRKIRLETEKNVRKTNGTENVNLKDIYDAIFEITGIDSEIGQKIEMEIESNFCTANPSMKIIWDIVKIAGKKIVVTSDMYLSSLFISSLLYKNGFNGFDDIFISNEYGCGKHDGMLYEIIKDKIGTDSITHIGDNCFSDVQNAKKHGISSFEYKNINGKGKVSLPYKMSPIIESAYIGLVNRKLQNGVFECSAAYEYGYKYGGMLTLGFCSFIHKAVLEKKPEITVFFSKGESFLIKIYEKLYSDDKTECAHWPEKAVAKIGADLFEKPFTDYFFSQSIKKRNTIYEVMDSIGISDWDFPFSLNDPLSMKNVDKVKKYLYENQEIISEYCNKMNVQNRQFFQKKLKDYNRVLIVVCDYEENESGVISKYINDNPILNHDLYRVVANYDGLFLFDDNRGIYSRSVKYNLCFDSLLCTLEQNQNNTDAIHKGASDYIDDYLSTFENYPFMKSMFDA